MRKFLSWLLTAGLLLVLSIQTVAAAVPQFINTQLRLRTSGGMPVTTATTVQFSLYMSAAGGAPGDAATSGGPLLWKEVYDGSTASCAQITPDAQGYVAVNLGACTSFPGYLSFNTSTLYLGVKVGTDSELSPRLRLGSSPFAMNADTVNGLSATTTAAASSLLALDSSFGFNIGAGAFTGGQIALASSTATSSAAGNWTVGGRSVLSGPVSFGSTTMFGVGSNFLYFNNTAATYLSWDNSNGRFQFSNPLLVSGAVTSSQMYASTGTFDNLVVTGTLSLPSGALSTSNVTTVNATSTNATSSNQYVTNTFVAAGTSTLATTTVSNLTVNGDAYLSSSSITNLSVSGTSTFSTSTFRSITVSATSTFATSTMSSLTVTNTTTLASLILSGLSQNSVLFVGVGGAVSQNTSSFVWDNTTQRLGIGTSAPDNALSVVGGISLASTTPATTSFSLYNQGGSLYWNGQQISGATSGSSFGDITWVNGTSTGVTALNQLKATGATNLTTTTIVELTVSGNTLLNNATTTGSWYATGSSTFSGPIVATATSSLATTTVSSLTTVNTTTMQGALLLGSFGRFTTAGDNFFYFNNSGSNYLQWDATNNRFVFSNDVQITGNATATIFRATTATFDSLSLNGPLNLTDLTFTNATGTTASIVSASTTNLTGVNALFTNVTSTNATTTNFAATLGTLTNAVLGNATSTNFFATNIVATNATSTYLHATTGTFDNLIFNGSLNLASLTFTNATGTNLALSGAATFTGTSSLATTTVAQLDVTRNATIGGDLTVTGSATATIIHAATGSFDNLQIDGTSNFQNLTWVNATGTNASLNTASITNLTGTNSALTNVTSTNATSTNSFVTTFTATFNTLANVTSTNVTSTNFFASLLSFTNATGGNLTTTNFAATLGTLTNAVLGNATSTNFFATNLVATNATTTGSQYVGGNLTAAGTSTLATTTISSLTLSGLTGFLRGTNGLVSTSTIGPGDLSNFNDGQVVFGSPTGSVMQTSSLVWNNTSGALSIGTTTAAARLTVEGNIQNLIGPNSGVQVVASTTLGYGSRGFAKSGANLFVTNAASNTLSAINISNPRNPIQISSTTVGTQPSDVAVAGEYAFVVNRGSDDVTVLNVRDPSLPFLVKTVSSVGASPVSIDIRGRYAYVLNYVGTYVSVLDIGDPEYTKVVYSGPSTGVGPVALTFDGNYMYIAHQGENTVGIYSLYSPNNPNTIYITHLSVGSGPSSVAVSGRYLYVGHATDSLYIADMQDPINGQVVLASTTVGANVRELVVAGRYLYAVQRGTGKLLVIDISSPLSPVLAHSIDIDDLAYDLKVYGRYAYVSIEGSPGKMLVIDVTGTEVTSLIAQSAQVGGLQASSDVAVRGRLEAQQSLDVGNGGINSTGPLAVVSLAPSFIGPLLGVGTTTINDVLQVAGDIRVGTAGTNGCLRRYDGTGLIGSCSSDIRLKKDLEPLNNVLEKLVQLTPSTYFFRSDEFPDLHLGNSRQYGLIAQDTEQYLPELVSPDVGRGYMGIHYHLIPIYLLQGVKELNAKLVSSTDRLANDLTAVRSRVELLEATPRDTSVNINTSTVLSMIQNAEISLLTLNSLVVEGNARVGGKLTVYGHAEFGVDSVGEAKILAGSQEVRVTFENPYVRSPIVVATPVDFEDPWKLKSVATSSFVLALTSPTTTRDVIFNWHAFLPSERARMTVSDAPVVTPRIDVVVPDATPESEPADSAPLTVPTSTVPVSTSTVPTTTTEEAATSTPTIDETTAPSTTPSVEVPTTTISGADTPSSTPETTVSSTPSSEPAPAVGEEPSPAGSETEPATPSSSESEPTPPQESAPPSTPPTQDPPPVETTPPPAERIPLGL